MKQIEINKNYSISEAVEYTPLKTRDTLSRYINRYQGAEWSTGKVWIKKFTNLNGVTSFRYSISGAWIKAFNKLYTAKKLNDYNVFSPEEVKYTLKDMIDYCKKYDIITVKQFIEHKNNEKNK